MRNYKNENIDAIYIVSKILFLKVKNSLLELEKDCVGLKVGELKNKEVKIKRKIEEP